MGRYRVYTIEFKKQIVQEHLGDESLHGLSKRHQISCNLVRIRIAKYEAGESDDDQAAAAMLAEYEAKIALLESKVGQLAQENVLLKKTAATATVEDRQLWISDQRPGTLGIT